MSEYPNLDFEPGIHGVIAETSKRANQVAAGNLDVSVWNHETIKRILERPIVSDRRLFAVDGNEASEHLLTVGGNIYQREAQYIWVGLPARPSKLHPSKKVLVVLGDQNNYPSNIKVNGKQEYLLRADKQHERDTSYPDPSAEINDNMHYLLGLNAICAIGGLTSLLPHSLTRRAFISGFIASLPITAGINVIASQRYDLPYKAARTISNDEKERALQLADLIGPKLVMDLWVQARTAMLILKTKDAIDYLDLPKGTQSTVLMGGLHSYEANSFLSNDAESQKRIAEYFTRINLLVKESYEFIYGGLPYTARDMSSKYLAGVADYLAATDVYEISDPGDKPQIPETGELLPHYMKLVASFPSPRVAKAFNI